MGSESHYLSYFWIIVFLKGWQNDNKGSLDFGKRCLVGEILDCQPRLWALKREWVSQPVKNREGGRPL